MKLQDNSYKKIKFRGKEHEYFVHRIGYARFNEVDAYGVVWNGHYINYCEIGRHALCRHYGFDMKQLSDEGYYLPVYNFDVSVRIPIRTENEVFVAVRMSSYTDSNYEFFHLILSERGIHAYGSVKHTIVDSSAEIVTNVPLNIRTILSKITSPPPSFQPSELSL